MMKTQKVGRRAALLLIALVFLTMAFTTYFAAKVSFDWVVVKKLTVLNEFVDHSLMMRFQDVAATSTTNVISESLVAGETEPATVTQLDYPRNMVFQVTASTTATAGSIVVIGDDGVGNLASEVFSVGAISGTQNITGSVAWSKVTSVTFPAQVITVTLKAGGGKKFGLPFKPKSDAVYRYTLNNTYTTTYTFNATYGTIEPDALSANDDLTIWARQ